MSDIRAFAYVFWAQWVARCPRPYCTNAEHYGRARMVVDGAVLYAGSVGGLTLNGFRCARCGLVCESEWPENAEDIWWVLAQRPVVDTRSWNLGETLEDLIVENIAHDIMPAGIAPGTPLRIYGGKLADRSLVGSSRSAIAGA